MFFLQRFHFMCKQLPLDELIFRAWKYVDDALSCFSQRFPKKSCFNRFFVEDRPKTTAKQKTKILGCFFVYNFFLQVWCILVNLNAIRGKLLQKYIPVALSFYFTTKNKVSRICLTGQKCWLIWCLL